MALNVDTPDLDEIRRFLDGIGITKSFQTVYNNRNQEDVSIEEVLQLFINSRRPVQHTFLATHREGFFKWLREIGKLDDYEAAIDFQDEFFSERGQKASDQVRDFRNRYLAQLS